MSADDARQLRRDVRYLLDRTAIVDCIANHARGGDRYDSALLTSTYHADGIDEHGHAIIAGPDYADWAIQTHSASARAHLHNITTHVCDIDGDVAHCETYVLAVLLGRDGRTAQLINGRYIDRLERRDGTWRIAVRRTTVEAMVTADASALQSDFFRRAGFSMGAHDTTDLSYQRPLTIESPAPARW